MEKIELQIIALSGSTSQPGNFIVVLEQSETLRKLPVVIGPAEAQSIAVCLERMQPIRPLTHDLYKNTLDQLQVVCREVIITSFSAEVFYAQLILKRADGSLLEVDSRTSDALAIAVRCGCPIYTYATVLDDAAFYMESGSKIFIDKKGELSAFSLEELQALLARVVAKEDYESAVRIRNVIAEKQQSGENQQGKGI